MTRRKLNVTFHRSEPRDCNALSTSARTSTRTVMIVVLAIMTTTTLLSLSAQAALVGLESSLHISKTSALTSRIHNQLQLTSSDSARTRFRPSFVSITSSSSSSSSSSTTLLRNGMWSTDDDLVGTDRYKACIPYMLPLLDGDQFGQFIYDRIPPLGFLHSLFLGPLAHFYHQIPFLGVLIFIALTLGTRFNTDMPRNVRFSAQQAAMLDVALIFPELIASCLHDVAVPVFLAEPCSNFVWYAYMSAVLYCIYSNLRGKKPDQIPYISGSAEFMVGPF